MKTIKIGRSSECDIVLLYDKISRVHAYVSYQEGQFLYQDVSKNGSVISGRVVINEKLVLAPGTTVLLANKIPLPWKQVYDMIAPGANSISNSATALEDHNRFNPSPEYFPNHQYVDRSSSASYVKDELGVGLGVLAFLIPLAGFIMYFSWKNETPDRARMAGLIGLASFVISLIALL